MLTSHLPKMEIAAIRFLRTVPNESVRRFTNNFDNISLMPITLHHLPRMAISRSLFPSTTLNHALHRIGFVQADPIPLLRVRRDLILRHRVEGLPRGRSRTRYAKLGVHKTFSSTTAS